MKIGIVRERKTPPDFRVPLTPVQCADLQEAFPGTEIQVESYPDRSYSDEEYKAAGIPVVLDLHACDILLGVKEVPPGQLIFGKTYLFFSHTIKKQPYNRNLLRTCIEKKIQLIDYEALRDANDTRIIGFGRYAGIVGAYNGFRGYGLKKGSYQLKPAHQCFDKVELYNELKKVSLPPIKILLTGGGKVGNGAREILTALNIHEVSMEAYLTDTFDYPAFTQVEYPAYNKRKDGMPFDAERFTSHPEEYVSDFGKFLPHTHFLIAGHFWSSRSPKFFSQAELAAPETKIELVADISCDLDGPIPSTLRASTITDPFYGYNPATGEETTPFDAHTITVMAVDNLPCELPRDASNDFGKTLTKQVLRLLINEPENPIIRNSVICENGTLTPPFAYLQDYLDGK